MANHRSEAAARYPYNAAGGRDHLSWAKQILFRLERNDTDLTAHQINEAKRAMRVAPFDGPKLS